MAFDLDTVQRSLKRDSLCGWLLTDINHRDLMAYRLLGIPLSFTSRRWFYFIPEDGVPVKLVSRVEPARLDALPGERRLYLSWEQLHAQLKSLLGGMKRVAMQYSPMNHLPAVSIVDAGTVELLRSFGVEIVSSANLVQEFEAVMDDNALESHREAARAVQDVRAGAFRRIRQFLNRGESLNEYQLQQWISRKLARRGLTTSGESPIVAVNEHAASPHYQPGPEGSSTFHEGDLVLIEIWAKLDEPGSVFYDTSWCGYVGEEPPKAYVERFSVIVSARKAALDMIRDRFASDEPVFGYEVDDVCRRVVAEAGYGEAFVHRTGHSIGEDVHGYGVHMDNLETRDDRQLLPGICFSIEPGIYLPGEMGMRTEINVYIKKDREIVVEGEEQEQLVPI